MKQVPNHIEKTPALRPAEDFYGLRREGIGFVEQMGSQFWTDYNLHDPGITLLEALCYAITDLAYRAGWSIPDLLSPETAEPLPADPTETYQPYPKQAFFTARDILTVNAWTPDDFRRLLIDGERVRNAWFFCKDCPCDLVQYLAWCDAGQLHLAYQLPPDKPFLKIKNADGSDRFQKIGVRGLSETLLELENDPALGDLNDRKIERKFWFDIAGERQELLVEMRFPDWGLAEDDIFQAFLDSSDPIEVSDVPKFSRSKTLSTILDPADLRRHWQTLFYLSLEIKLDGGATTFVLENISVRFFSRTAVRDHLAADLSQAGLLLSLFKRPDETGFVIPFREKLRAIRQSIASAKNALHAHRNLSEDFCSVRRVAVEDVAVCADVEVEPDADIEQVQARIWLEIEQYFNPPVPFFSLQEMLAAGEVSEDIFNGPPLSNGFIRQADLDAAQLKTELRVSDLLNRLMDLPGVRSVNNLLLTKYDAEGLPAAGAADLHAAQPNLKKISAEWTLAITPLHQPRLYHNLSRFLFYKNGLPLLPRRAETLDILTQLRGATERPKFKNAERDLPIPVGTFRRPADFLPVQYSLPTTYGTGPEGIAGALPTVARQAKALQLKGFLLVFEQILANANVQIAQVAKLFSLDDTLDKTYFTQLLDEARVQGSSQIFDPALTIGTLQTLLEPGSEFDSRRNRFLDHLLARFGEQFTEYALLLTNAEGQAVASDDLILSKIKFLEANKEGLNRDRAMAFDYKNDPTVDLRGLKLRVSRLLNFDADTERFIIVEHLLLRPRYPGAPLFPACSEAECLGCSDDKDPYSFRLTFVMPGWGAAFNANLEMRRFAERSIRQETPAHLLQKICWVGNDDASANLCDPIFHEVAEIIEDDPNFKTNLPLMPDFSTKIAEILAADPDTDAPEILACREAHTCADAILLLYEAHFESFFTTNKLQIWEKEVWKTQVKTEVVDKVAAADLVCLGNLTAETQTKIQLKVWEYFTEIAFRGKQFERFEAAWDAWLAADAQIDWTEERLHERVEAILKKNFDPTTAEQLNEAAVCNCSSEILTAFGNSFFEWMTAAVAAGTMPATLDLAVVKFPAGFDVACWAAAGTKTEIEQMLQERYEKYIETAFRLAIVLRLLAGLNNVYPGATLHDCDDGSDQNPVRLGSTALGNYPRKPRPKKSVAATTAALLITRADVRKKIKNRTQSDTSPALPPPLPLPDESPVPRRRLTRKRK